METEGLNALPVGRILRLAAGALMCAQAVWTLYGHSPRAWLEVLAIIVGFVVFYGIVHLVVTRYFSQINPWVGAALAVTPLGLVFFLGTGLMQVAAIAFVGLSLIPTAIRADGGCEVMTIPALFLGKRTHLVCIAFSPLDWVERRVARIFSHSTS